MPSPRKKGRCGDLESGLAVLFIFIIVRGVAREFADSPCLCKRPSSCCRNNCRRSTGSSARAWPCSMLYTTHIAPWIVYRTAQPAACSGVVYRARAACQIDLCANGPSVTHEKHTRDKFGVILVTTLHQRFQISISQKSHANDSFFHEPEVLSFFLCFCF